MHASKQEFDGYTDCAIDNQLEGELAATEADRFDHDSRSDYGNCQQDINGILALISLNFLHQGSFGPRLAGHL